MTAARHLTPSPEAEWQGVARVWAGGVQQFPPKRDRSSWWIVAACVVLVAVALAGLK